MANFIRTLHGKISAINYSKKEFSICVEETAVQGTGENKLDFYLDRNVRVTNTANHLMKITALKAGQKVEIGYSTDKSKKIASYIIIQTD